MFCTCACLPSPAGLPRLYSLWRNPQPVESWADVKPALVTRRVKRLSRRRLPGYADGGLVTAPQSTGAAQVVRHAFDGTLHVALDEGVIARAITAHIASPNGQKQVLDVSVKHRGKLARVLGG